MPSSFDAHIASLISGSSRVARYAAPAAGRWLGRPFSRRAQVRVAIHWHSTRISYSQVHPFLHYAEALRARHGAEIRLFDVATFLADDRPLPDADLIMIQPWFDADPTALSVALDRQRARAPGARITFLDSFAHNDLRLGQAVDPYVSYYIKKTLYRDQETYFLPNQGHTRLSDYYDPLYGLDEPVTCWGVPRSLLPKLRLSPNFFTAPRLLDAFMAAPPDFEAERPIDMHARLTARGAGWYGRMREDWIARAAAMTDLETAAGTGIELNRFMAELGRSKLVLSPFGYGEPCWRDIEGILAGAVVVKQDMSHLESLPDLFRPWETYAPVAWDLSDLEDVVRRLLADPGLRERIARTAWQEVRTYLETERFVDDMGFLFEG